MGQGEWVLHILRMVVALEVLVLRKKGYSFLLGTRNYSRFLHILRRMVVLEGLVLRMKGYSSLLGTWNCFRLLRMWNGS